MLPKYIKKLVIIALLSTSLTVLSAGFAYAEKYREVTVTADILNLRESPDTSSKIIGKLKKGSQLKVLQSSGEWYKVSIDRLTGWVSIKYVTSANTSNEPKSTTDKNTDKNVNTNANASNNSSKNENTSTSKNNTTNKMTEAAAVKYGKITGNNVNVRKGPGLSYSVIKQLNKGALLEILDKTEKWYQVKLSDNVLGWVSSSYISECKETIEETNDKNDNKKENQSANTSVNDSGKDSGEGSGKDPGKVADISQSISAGEQGSQTGSSDTKNTDYETPASQTSEEGTVVISQLIDFAQSLVGVKYMYGGTSPETGFDCSGFTQYVFGSFGIKLERVAADQAKQGVEVKQEELLPGDLVFSDTDGGNNNINHVGIYIGDGKFISATSGSNSAKVTVTSLESSYWKSTYMTARRIVLKTHYDTI